MSIITVCPPKDVLMNHLIFLLLDIRVESHVYILHAERGCLKGGQGWTGTAMLFLCRLFIIHSLAKGINILLWLNVCILYRL